jgi:hypothetical protein
MVAPSPTNLHCTALPALPCNEKPSMSPTLRLPYPFNIMNPAEIPEEVWQQARAAQKNTS